MRNVSHFSLAYINRLIRRAGNAARLGEDGRDGWQTAKVDFERIVSIFDHLRIRTRYVLCAYTFREGDNGNGFVYAMPVDVPFPEPEECPTDSSHFLNPPVPAAALPNVMAAIDGDGTPESYIQASLLARELHEFGARWHGCDWSTQQMLASNPRTHRVRTRPMGVLNPARWEWLENPEEDWRPRVNLAAAHEVVFYTYSALGRETLTRHMDRYRVNTYEFEQHPTVIGLGESGFEF